MVTVMASAEQSLCDSDVHYAEMGSIYGSIISVPLLIFTINLPYQYSVSRHLCMYKFIEINYELHKQEIRLRILMAAKL